MNDVFFLGIRYAVTPAQGVCDRVRHHKGGQTQPAAFLLTPAAPGSTHSLIPMCQACFKLCTPVSRHCKRGLIETAEKATDKTEEGEAGR